MADSLSTLGNTLVHHGPHNDRIYVMHLDPDDMPGLVDDLAALARQHEYGKIVAKVPAPLRAPFLEAGYAEEARIPGLVQGREDIHFLCRYLDTARADEPRPDVLAANLALALAKQASGEPPREPSWDDAVVMPATEEDVEAMSQVYREVFPTYPFPIHDPGYLEQCMQEDVAFFKVERHESILALASAEMTPADANAEMTDFATLPPLRGKGAAQGLLTAMEDDMDARGMATLFTIARAYSAGMNVTFAKAGYEYGGTLTANTNIGGSIESMNVWYKRLGEPSRD